MIPKSSSLPVHSDTQPAASLLASTPVRPSQLATRRRDPLLIGGWRAGLTYFLCVVLFVTFIGGPTAILRACEDDPDECEGDFDMDSDYAASMLSDSEIGVTGTNSDPATAGTSPTDALNQSDPLPPPAPAGTEPVVDPITEPPAPPEPTTTPDTISPIEPPPTAPEPVPESSPVAPVSESSLPDPSTDTPPDATPPNTSVAETTTESPPADTSPGEVPADNSSAPVSDPPPDTSGAPPADDSSWSSDTSNTELASQPLSLIDAKSLTFHDDGGAWDGVNKFRVHDGNARRVIPELHIRGTVSQLGLSWTRYSNTIERAGRRNFGTASHWRHS